MSRTRQQPHPWLSDHVLFFGYRWLAWVLALVLVVWHSDLLRYGTLLVIAALVNVLSTVLAQPYVRAARRNPAVMSLDLLYTIPILLSVDGWNWPFFPYAVSSLVIPALLFGWRGGLMAGLSFVSLNLMVSYALGRPPTTIVASGSWFGWGGLLVIMLVPPLFGLLLPSLVELARNLAAQRTDRHSGNELPYTRDMDRNETSDVLDRFVPSRGREPETSRTLRSVEPAPIVRPAIVRAADHAIEEVRRVMFAPLPSAELDLLATLDTLAARFGQHTGLAAHVTPIGRTRAVHQAHRNLLVRLTQEALLNVQQHAHAHSVELTVHFDVSSVALMIQDDGVGLLDGTFERPGLHALRAMQYRLTEFGGRLDVFEPETGGVTVRATVPIE